jgi:hypothetical protein
MKTAAILTALLLVPVPLVSVATDQPKLNCVKDITYNPKFLQDYPNAPAACREVIIKDGQKWARFEANVVKVNGKNVTAEVMDAYNNTISTVTFTSTSPKERVLVDGSPTTYSSLQKGQTLTFWVPDHVMGLYATPTASQATKLAVIERSNTKVR